MASSIHPQAEDLSIFFPFSQLGEEDLFKIARYFEVIEYSTGSILFSDGYPAGDLFFVVSGTIKLVLHEKRKDIPLGLLHNGDWFGLEALSRNSVYLTRATAQTAVTVLRIRGVKARTIADAYPLIHNGFTLMQHSFHLSCKEQLDWRPPDEAIILMSRRHPFFFYLRILLNGGATLIVFSFLLFAALASDKAFSGLLVLSLLILIGGGLLCFWSGLEWRNDYFILTRERVCVQKKVIGFYESRHESPISAILSVGIDTSLLGRMFDLGAITVRSYTGDLQFKRLPYPYVIHNLLETRKELVEQETEVSEKSEIRQALTHPQQGVSPKLTPSDSGFRPVADHSYQSGSLADGLARFFHLREQNADAITYRTHWWVLFKKTFLPALFVMAVVLLTLLRLLGMLTTIPEGAVYSGAAILFILGLLWWGYQYQDWGNDIYIITSDQLIDVYKKPLGNEDRRSAPVRNIQTVEFERKGLACILLNFGTVRIKIGNEELTFDNVYNPSQVQTEIYTRYRAFLATQKKNEQQRFVEWIKAYDEMRTDPNQHTSAEDTQEKG